MLGTNDLCLAFEQGPAEVDELGFDEETRELLLRGNLERAYGLADLPSGGPDCHRVRE
ncbi:MAG: hypothetical protein OXG37_05615 [Actinomycetia bacterium]|nr:hypothetical protein [Actinomycetes bacterium]